MPDAADIDLADTELSVWFGTALLPAGWADGVRVRWRSGVISSVEHDTRCQAEDARHAIGMPGVSNLHSHAFQRALAGLTEQRRGADSFWSWRDTMYGFMSRLGPDALEAVTAQAYVEMLEAGITRVGEFHYLHHDVNGARHARIAEHAERVAAAAQLTGIGLTLLPVFYAHSGVGGQAPLPQQCRFITSLDEYARLLQDSRTALAPVAFANVGVAAHSLRAVTVAQLHELCALAGSGPMHIHIAEQLAEVEQWRQWAGCRPVEWLLANTEVDARWCLVHATHVTPSEVANLAASGATVGLCPITEANLGDGVFPARAYLDHGGRFGIGTDSNVLIDLAEELRLLEYGQRLWHRERNVLHGRDTGRSTGRSLLETSLIGGRRALQADTGQIAPGCLADFIALSDASAGMIGRGGDALLDSWIFGGVRCVESVWSAGREVVRAGRHVAQEQIAARYAVVLRELLA